MLDVVDDVSCFSEEVAVVELEGTCFSVVELITVLEEIEEEVALSASELAPGVTVT